MNILWVSLYPPLPLNFGGPVGIYHRLVELSKYNNIFLFYINEENNATYDKRLQEYCTEVHSYPRNKILNVDTLKTILKYPFTAATRNISHMQDEIEQCIKEKNINLINVEFPQMCVNLGRVHLKHREIPIVLHEHNNEWLRFSQMADTVSGMKKILYKREANSLFRFEKEIEDRGLINLYTFLSNQDQENFAKTFEIDIKRTHLVPLGGNIVENNHLNKRLDDEKIIMFCAAMDSEMNQEAVIWFVKEIFPIIKENIEKVKFYIVGRNPNNEISDIANEDIIVTGTVEDLGEYYLKSDLIVIPLLHGGGVKVKLLEAIEYNKNIVTTSVGIEGTLFDRNNQIPVCDEKEKFAMKCIQILSNEDYAEKLRYNTRQFFLRHYTWNQIGKEYNEILETCVSDFINK